MRPHVTVIVTVKDRRERMLRCVDAVLRQDYPRFDFLIVDNCSSDGTAETCRERSQNAPVPVQVVVSAGSVGHVRNVGVDMAEGELIAFTDSDCMPTEGWLGAGVSEFERDAEVGVVQGRTLPEPGQELGCWEATVNVPEWSGAFEGCNLFMRREAARQAGGFPETVRHFWADTATGWAIVRRGFRAVFASDALVYHDVTYPGLTWHLRRRALRYGDVVAVVRERPQLRGDLLWKRHFLRPRSAKVAAAVLGLVLAPVTRKALLLALPYAWFRRPRRPTPSGLLGSGQGALFDLAIFFDMVRSSIRYRTLVL